jgi:uncharacterized protein
MDATAASNRARKLASEPAGFPGRYLSLTTFRRDGRGVATPVWFVQDGGLILVQTGEQSGKVKRIRRNPAVTIARCTASGRVRGRPVPARACLLPATREARAEQLFRRKYRFDLLVLRPLRAVAAVFGRRRAVAANVYLEITPG